MKVTDILRLARENLRRRKGRTALTVIGVVVGTCAIVVMISLGLAMSQSIESMLASWGDLTQIQIYNYVYGSTDAPTLDDEMLASIKALEHVTAVTPYYQARNVNATIVAGKNDRYNSYFYETYGLYPDAVEALGIQLISGNYLTETTDVGKGKIPVLVGENFAYSFYDSTKDWNSSKYQVYQGQTDALGNPVDPFVNVEKDKMWIRLQTWDDDGNEKHEDYQMVVVGVMASDYAKGYFTDSGIVMRLADLKRLEQAYEKLAGKRSSGSASYMVGVNGGGMVAQQDNGYENVYVKVDSVDHVEEVEEIIQSYGYQTNSMVQTREAMQAQVAQTQFILGGLAAISLFVAALNIANTMTMAIYERTREIGVMKVLGCELGKIRTLFLVEAGGIGFLGGVIGVILSLIISFIMNNFALIAAVLGFGGAGMGDLSSIFGMYTDGSSAASVIPIWLILFALAFATLVGVLSGIMPAVRATKISALEAIRHE